MEQDAQAKHVDQVQNWLDRSKERLLTPVSEEEEPFTLPVLTLVDLGKSGPLGSVAQCLCRSC